MALDIQSLLAALGGQGDADGADSESQSEDANEPKGTGNWLVDAINAVHAGMVQEHDPKQVSLLGAILNQLTTFQANKMAPSKGSGG